MTIKQSEDGTCRVVGDTPQEIVISKDLLDRADPPLMTVEQYVVLHLADGELRYRVTGPHPTMPRCLKAVKVEGEGG